MSLHLDDNIDTYVWIHEHQRQDPEYRGGYPEDFEERLMTLLGSPHEKDVLHVFGGKAQHGVRVDVNPRVNPDILGDAHNLEIPDNTYKVVTVDPPFTDWDNINIYRNNMKIRLRECIDEAVRVCKIDGYVVTRHINRLRTPKRTREVKRIVLIQCIGRKVNLCQVFQKIK